MHLIRRIREKDFEDFKALAFEATTGIISLPKNEELLWKKIHEPTTSLHLFVLEDLETKKVIGTSSIHPHLHHTLFFKYDDLLSPVFAKEGVSEVCGLFLSRLARKEGLGKLLSYSRFLFIAENLSLFDKEVMATMRGIIKNDRSPFWETLGKKFYQASLEEVLEAMASDKEKVQSFFPKHPIYPQFLSKKGKKVIGEAHKNTKAALKLLLEEGFIKTPYIDIIDGGPIISAKTADVKIIKESKRGQVVKIEAINNPAPYLISNTAKDFCALFGEIEVISPYEVKLSEQTAKHLSIKNGDNIRYVKI